MSYSLDDHSSVFHRHAPHCQADGQYTVINRMQLESIREYLEIAIAVIPAFSANARRDKPEALRACLIRFPIIEYSPVYKI